MRLLLILLGGILSATAADLPAYIKEARAHHAAFADSVHSEKIVRRATILSEDPPQVILFKKYTRGNLRREETITDSPDSSGKKISVTEIFDGTFEWQINSETGVQKVGNGLEHEPAPSSEYWIAPPPGSTIVQADVMDNRPCWMIKSEPTASYPYSYVWLDRDNYVMIRAESEDDEHHVTIIENTKLREVLPGFAIPTLTTIRKDFHPSMTLEVLDLELNADLPDSLFEVTAQDSLSLSGDPAKR